MKRGRKAMNARRSLTAGIAALFASAGAVALSSSPAQASSECKPFSDARWDAAACIDHTGTNARAGGELIVHPSNCATFRVYLVAEGTAGDVVLRSTSALPCDYGYAFTEMTVSVPTRTKSRILAWDSSDNRILYLQTEAHNGV